MMKLNQENIITSGIIAGAIIIITLLVLPNFERWVDLQEQKNTYEAVQGCGLTNSVVWTDLENEAQVTEPYKPAYQQCLKDKGIK